MTPTPNDAAHRGSGPLEPLSPDGPRSVNGYGGNGYHGDAPAPPRAPRRSSSLRPLLWCVSIALLCGLSAFLISSYAMTPWYSAATTLYFPSSGSSGAASLLGSIAGVTPGDGAGNVSLLGGIYSSPSVGSAPTTAMSVLATGRCQGKVLKDLNLPARWHLPPDEAFVRLNKNLVCGVDRNGFLAIQANDPDPRLAVQIVSDTVQAMQDVSTHLSAGRARLSRIDLQKKRDSTQNQLLAQQNALVALQTHATRALPLGATAATAYADLLNQRVAAQVALDGTNAQIRWQRQAMKAAAGQSSALPAQVPFAQAARARLRDLESQYVVAEQTLGDENPAFQKIKAQVQEARAQYQAEVQGEMSSAQKGFAPNLVMLYDARASLVARLRDLNQEVSVLQADVISLPAAQMREARLKDEIELNEGLLKTLAEQTQIAEIAESRDALPTFEIVDPVALPQRPSSPRVTFATAFAAIAGFLLALAWQIGRTVLRQPVLQADIRRTAERYRIPEDEDDARLLAETDAPRLDGQPLAARAAPRLPGRENGQFPATDTAPSPAERPLPERTLP